ncbi:hypothetical protein BFW89_03465 [Pseudomonas synxantha]|nr:hypothetical protein BFW89_03465 [Pseudomonas synxantha]VCU66638.1 hypothetical protein [Pseudomonas synxantha]
MASLKFIKPTKSSKSHSVFQYIHVLRSYPSLRRNSTLGHYRHTCPHTQNSLLPITTYSDVVLLPYHQVEVPPGDQYQGGSKDDNDATTSDDPDDEGDSQT